MHGRVPAPISAANRAIAEQVFGRELVLNRRTGPAAAALNSVMESARADALRAVGGFRAFLLAQGRGWAESVATDPTFPAEVRTWSEVAAWLQRFDARSRFARSRELMALWDRYEQWERVI